VTIRNIFIVLFCSTVFFRCKESVKNITPTEINLKSIKPSNDSLRKKLKENIQFLNDSLLKEKGKLLSHYFEKYQFDSCGIISYQDSILKLGFEPGRVIGDIRNNNSPDTVFIFPPFNYCDQGYSYVFSDSSLPRLLTDSYCCHPDNLFSIGDIDEDGLSEICVLYSSCASRLKALIAYRLNNNEWKQIGSCDFDINYPNPMKEKRVRKISKNRFEILQVLDDKNVKWKQFLL